MVVKKYLFLFPMFLAFQLFDIGQLYYDLGLTAELSLGLHGFRDSGELSLYLMTAVLSDAFFLLVMLWVGASLLGRWKCPGWMVRFQISYLAGLMILIHFSINKAERFYFKEPADFKALSLLVDGNYSAVLGLNKTFTFIAIISLLLVIGLNILIVYGRKFIYKKSERAGKQLVFPSIYRIMATIFFPLLAVATYTSSKPDVRFALNQKLSYAVLFFPIDKILNFDGDGFGIYGLYRDPDIFSKNSTPFVFHSGSQSRGVLGKKPDSMKQAIPVKIQLPKNVVLIVLEGMRPEILWKKLDSNWIAPHLNALAESGSYSRHMYSHTGTTIFSKQAIFFGTAGLVENHKSVFSEFSDNMYKLAVFSCMDESFGGLDQISKMRELSESFCDAACRGSQPVFSDTSSVNRAIDENWVYHQFKKYADSQNWSVPHFIYFNLQATHYPYNHPKVPKILNRSPITQSEILNGDKLKLKKTYYNSAHYIDETIGNIIQTLKDLGQWENTLLIAVGDHGESLFDDGSLGHGSSLNDNQTNTLIVSNQALIKTDCLLGLDQVKEMLLTGLTGELEINKSNREVLQYLGLVTEPIQIASIDEKCMRTTIDFRKSRIFDPISNYWYDLQSLSLGSPLDIARNRLMDEWNDLKQAVPPMANSQFHF